MNSTKPQSMLSYPINGYIIVNLLKEENCAAPCTSGIAFGNVAAVEDNQVRYVKHGDPMYLKNGDKIQFKLYESQRMTIEGTEFFIIKESSIISVIEIV